MSDKQITQPELLDVLNTLKENIFANFHSHKIGIIQKFNAENQTAEIQLVDKIKSPTGQIITRSLLVDCPVVVLRGGNASITFPIEKNDHCLVLFNDTDIDNWFSSGNVQEVNTSRKHDLNDGIALVGISHLGNVLEDYSIEAVEIKKGNSKISAKEGGGEINVDDKLELKNLTTTLKSVMDDLVTLLLALKTVDPISGLLPIDGATTTALTNLQIKINGLLK